MSLPRGVPPPLHFDWSDHWLTPYEFASVMQRSYPRVISWCRSGTLRDFGITYFRTNQPSTNRGSVWWIKCPPNLL